MDNLQRVTKLAVALTALVFLAGCSQRPPLESHVPKAGFQKGDRRVYFSMSDPKGDDRGPGFYQYPLRFNNREGFFDITNFQVEDGGANVLFRITTRRPIDKFRPDGSSEAKGWFLQLMDIYIDKDRTAGSGVTRTLPGRWVQLAEDCAWEQMVLVTPNRSLDVRRQIEARTNDLGLVHLKPRIVIPRVVFVEGFDFIVQVPKSDIGEPQPHWGYQVLMLPFDEQNLANGQFQNGVVKKFPTDKDFGGGTDYLGDPNVIDILAPSEQLQRQWLSSYVASPVFSDNVPATVRCVYGDGTPKPAGQPASAGPSGQLRAPPPMRAPLLSRPAREQGRPEPRPREPSSTRYDFGEAPAPVQPRRVDPRAVAPRLPGSRPPERRPNPDYLMPPPDETADLFSNVPRSR